MSHSKMARKSRAEAMHRQLVVEMGKTLLKNGFEIRDIETIGNTDYTFQHWWGILKETEEYKNRENKNGD